MNIVSSPTSSGAPYVFLTHSFLFWFFCILAANTVITHGYQLFGWSFGSYVIVNLLVCMATTLVITYASVMDFRQRFQQIDMLPTTLAMTLVLCCALLGLFSMRPDSDDYYYVPAAVHALQNPADAMGFQVRGLIPSLDEPIISYNISTSLPFEYFSAVIAYWLNIEYLTIYYHVIPFFVSGAIAASLIYFAGQFNLNSMATVLGCFVAVAILLLMGETHRSYGNFAFTRSFQGKTLLLGCGITVFAAATIDFFRSPRLSAWLFLAAISTAMVGATSSSIVIIPFLVIALTITIIANGEYQTSSKFSQTVGAFWSSTIYLLVYSLAYFLTGYAQSNLGIDSSVNSGFPKDFVGHLWKVVNRDFPFWLLVMTTAAVGLYFCAVRSTWNFFFVWIFTTVLLFLNPVLAPFLIEYITSPNIYWRLFYLLPVVPICAIAASCILDRFASNRTKQIIVASSAILLTLVAHVTFPEISIFRVARVGIPTYSLPQESLATARSIIRSSPRRGPMLAPPDITGIIPMLTSAYPQVLRRRQSEPMWLDKLGNAGVTTSRLRATEFAQNGGDSTYFMQVVRLLVPNSIVLTHSAWDSLLRSHQTTELESLGYEKPRQIETVLLIEKSSMATAKVAAEAAKTELERAKFDGFVEANVTHSACFVSAINNDPAPPFFGAVRGEQLELSGWTADKDLNVPSSIAVVLKAKDKAYRYDAVLGPDRNRAAEIIGKPELANAGYVSKIDLTGVAQGEYSLYIEQATAVGIRYCLVDNRKLSIN